jgi:hypothetical protein
MGSAEIREVDRPDLPVESNVSRVIVDANGAALQWRGRFGRVLSSMLILSINIDSTDAHGDQCACCSSRAASTISISP